MKKINQEKLNEARAAGVRFCGVSRHYSSVELYAGTTAELRRIAGAARNCGMFEVDEDEVAASEEGTWPEGPGIYYYTRDGWEWIKANGATLDEAIDYATEEILGRDGYPIRLNLDEAVEHVLKRDLAGHNAALIEAEIERELETLGILEEQDEEAAE